ncbi:MAG: methyltransferase domain-containing protein [Candidatus Thermoplasmatota archaeon]|nr:methyltransferase domain-containing protein [Candidatus Thermoplasmatota archaeon]
MLKKGQKWYKEGEVAKKYEDSRFTEGGIILDKEEKETLLSLVEPEGKDILDVATGTGRFAELLSREGGHLTGIDASREMLVQSEVESVQGDALKLPFKDNCFDISISMRFLHLLEPEDIDPFIQEVQRVTKDKFIFETLHPLSLRLLYQWALPQDSSLYSNSLLKEKFKGLDGIKKVRSHENFLIPYGIYQILPEDIAESISQIDERVVEGREWLASTIYWELSFR